MKADNKMQLFLSRNPDILLKKWQGISYVRPQYKNKAISLFSVS